MSTKVRIRSGVVATLAVVAIFVAGIAIGAQASKLRPKTANAGEVPTMGEMPGEGCGGAEGSGCGSEAGGGCGMGLGPETGVPSCGAPLSEPAAAKCDGDCDDADCEAAGCKRPTCPGDAENCSADGCSEVGCSFAKGAAEAKAECAACAAAGSAGPCADCLTKGVELSDEQRDKVEEAVASHQKQVAEADSVLRKAIEESVEGEQAAKLLASLK